jgi:4-aminobutyrate aminotransferase
MTTLTAPSIVTKLPGPKAKALIEKDERFVSQHFKKDYPLVVEEASGMVVTDPDGNRFLDFAAGIAVCSTGHCHPRVVAAIREQAGKLLHMCPTDFYTRPVAELAERLAQVAPVRSGGGSPRVFFTNSGAEAVETSIKLARLRTKRQKIVAFFGAFHGRTMGAVSLTASKAVQRKGYGPMLPEVHHTYYAQCYRCPVGLAPETCDVECLDHLEKTLFKSIAPPEEIAAIIVEPVQGEGGYFVPKKEFLTKLRTLADEHGILLIADEVQAGMGRTGKLFASEHFDLKPDIIVLAKGIASGMPLAAIVAGDKLLQWSSGGHGSTYGGNAVSCAAALATLDLLQEGLTANAAKVGAHLLGRLQELKAKHQVIGDARGLGLMLAIDLVKDRETRAPAKDLVDPILKAAFERGLLLLGCGESSIRLAPPLIVTEEEADVAGRILDEALATV